MGSGGRLDPTQIKVADVSDSYGCQFAQVVRKKIQGWGIRSGFNVVFSPEPVPKKVVVHGLNDFIVVENDDLIFICKKSDEQEIKNIRQEVQKKFGDTFI